MKGKISSEGKYPRIITSLTEGTLTQDSIKCCTSGIPATGNNGLGTSSDNGLNLVPETVIITLELIANPIVLFNLIPFYVPFCGPPIKITPFVMPWAPAPFVEVILERFVVLSL